MTFVSASSTGSLTFLYSTSHFDIWAIDDNSTYRTDPRPAVYNKWMMIYNDYRLGVCDIKWRNPCRISLKISSKVKARLARKRCTEIFTRFNINCHEWVVISFPPEVQSTLRIHRASFIHFQRKLQSLPNLSNWLHPNLSNCVPMQHSHFQQKDDWSAEVDYPLGHRLENMQLDFIV